VDTWIHLSLVDTACKPFYEVIHFLVKIFQDAVHYVFPNFKMMFNNHLKTENFHRNLHVAVGELIICTNVVDIIFKNFNQVVDTLMKGFASGLHQ
jgi:hypothetical protein